MIEIIQVQYAFPVFSVLVLAILVYAFGFQSVAPPPRFDFVDADGRRTPAAKKRKPTKKTMQNGHVVTESLSSPKQNKQSNQSSPRITSANKPSPQKQKKEVVKEPEDIPADIDDGGWVQQISRKERKKRREESALDSEENHGGTPTEEEVKPKETPKAKKKGRERSKAEEDKENVPENVLNQEKPRGGKEESGEMNKNKPAMSKRTAEATTTTDELEGEDAASVLLPAGEKSPKKEEQISGEDAKSHKYTATEPEKSAKNEDITAADVKVSAPSIIKKEDKSINTDSIDFEEAEIVAFSEPSSDNQEFKLKKKRTRKE